jgi:four helix bundle protein
MGKNNILKDKPLAFALRIVNSHKYLKNEKHEFIMSKQLLRCGTSIGAMIFEAEYAQSTLDFINKMCIALKEANETLYWLTLLNKSEFINNDVYLSTSSDCQELIKMLTS